MINTQCNNELQYTNKETTSKKEYSYESTQQNTKSENLISNKSNGL